MTSWRNSHREEQWECPHRGLVACLSPKGTRLVTISPVEMLGTATDSWTRLRSVAALCISAVQRTADWSVP